MAFLLEAALMSGGNSYTNEPKTLTANGEYTPPDDVRWDKVTVDVPQGSVLADAVSAVPAFYSQDFPDGFTVELCIDLDNKMAAYKPFCSVYFEPSIKVGEPGNYNYKTAGQFNYSQTPYFKFIRVLKDGLFAFAMIEDSNSGFLYGDNYGWERIGGTTNRPVYGIVIKESNYCKAENISLSGEEGIECLLRYGASGSKVVTLALRANVKYTQFTDVRYYDTANIGQYTIKTKESDYTCYFSASIGTASSAMITGLTGTSLYRVFSEFYVAMLAYKGVTVADAYDFGDLV